MEGEAGSRPDLLFGVIAVELGFISSDQLRQTLRDQQLFPEPGMRPMLGQLLVDRKMITPSQLVRVLQTQRSRRDLPSLDVSPTRVALNLAPGSLLGRFQIVREIAEGGMGVVFEATQVDTGRRVALKVLRPGVVTAAAVVRLAREARISERLDHPAIVRVLEAGEVDDLPYFAMEYIDGIRLDTLLSGADVPLREVVEWLTTIARGLDAAHRDGVVHRDLKPGNILIDKQRNPHLTDFGLAMYGHEDLDLTGDGLTVGTPPYMAPEQVRGEREAIGPPTDIFALGSVMYEALTGSLPFHADSVPQLYERIVGDEPAPMRVHNTAIDAPLEAVCLRALEKAPGDRYPTAGAMADDLERYLADKPVRARRRSAIQRWWRRARRHRVVIVAVVVALVALAIGGALGVRAWLQSRDLDAQRRTELAAEEARTNRRRLADGPYKEALHHIAELRSVGTNEVTAAAAIRSLDEALAIDPTFAAAMAERGALRDLAGDVDAADDDFARAIDLDREAPTAHLYRGRARLERYELSRPIPQFTYRNDSLTIEPARAPSPAESTWRDAALADLRHAADLYRRLGYAGRLEESYVHYAEGVMAFYARDFAAAEARLAEARAAAPSLRNGLWLMKVRYYAMKFDAAIATADELLRGGAREWSIHHYRGAALLAQAVQRADPAPISRAREAFARAIEAAPGRWDAYRLRAMAAWTAATQFADARHLDEAVGDLEAALRIRGGDAQARNLLASILREIGVRRTDEGLMARAVEEAGRAVADDPREPIYRLSHGACLLTLGVARGDDRELLARAQEAYGRAAATLAEDDLKAQAFSGRAYARYLTADFQGALEDWEAATKLDPTKTSMHADDIAEARRRASEF